MSATQSTQYRSGGVHPPTAMEVTHRNRGRGRGHCWKRGGCWERGGYNGLNGL